MNNFDSTTSVPGQPVNKFCTMASSIYIKLLQFFHPYIQQCVISSHAPSRKHQKTISFTHHSRMFGLPYGTDFKPSLCYLIPLSHSQIQYTCNTLNFDNVIIRYTVLTNCVLRNSSNILNAVSWSWRRWYAIPKPIHDARCVGRSIKSWYLVSWVDNRTILQH